MESNPYGEQVYTCCHI